LSANSPSGKREKWAFISLLVLTGALLVPVTALLYLVPYHGFSDIHPSLPWIMALLMGGAVLAVLAVLGTLVASILLKRDIPFSKKLRSLVLKGLLPVLILVGKLVGLNKEQVQHAFVAINNELVWARCMNGCPPRRILLLMPHCLQDSECPVKITFRVQNCKRCGKCCIKDLLELTERYGADLAVATGGTSARRIVMQTRPDLIIAVACERDLTSGIQDTSSLPVYGIFNERPYGPCFNTRVSVEHVDSVLRSVTSRKWRQA
jgi:hypothetical protein